MSSLQSTSAVQLSIQVLQSEFAGPFSLDIYQGECIALLGGSGSGKSLFLRMIADLDPNTGSLYLNGQSREHYSAPEWRRNVIYQAAEPAWWERLAGDHFSNEEKEFIKPYFDSLGLSHAILEAEIIQLSTGERQRLALLRSLAKRPQLLLLDEPTGALDIATTLAVEALLMKFFQAGLSLLFVTHSEEQAKRIGHRLIRMHNRQLVA
ncbi:MAG: ABC transporter ATP-binding protein [Pseudomonadota bacterium]